MAEEKPAHEIFEGDYFAGFIKVETGAATTPGSIAYSVFIDLEKQEVVLFRQL